MKENTPAFEMSWKEFTKVIRDTVAVSVMTTITVLIDGVVRGDLSTDDIMAILTVACITFAGSFSNRFLNIWRV